MFQKVDRVLNDHRLELSVLDVLVFKSALHQGQQRTGGQQHSEVFRQRFG